ncbi:uncharacterized protein LY89DRAFT_485940 [Mollisia scopiformis]|uniref:Uncharacterized protein n=1 Tax=Mollisia scopiformis TaxID=149040 RepID=A0A194XGG5_MOLSC|nr:uncharacterized protein LY89DRAFT_485940 [Mollisia scopiformis]KUJ19231.1 hypothetical protein LY89DRAFT_485940 [Mollisia scopiformis]
MYHYSTMYSPTSILNEVCYIASFSSCFVIEVLLSFQMTDFHLRTTSRKGKSCVDLLSFSLLI